MFFLLIFIIYTVIGGLVFDIDYDYSISAKDFLKRKYNLYHFAELILQFILFFIANIETSLTFIVLFILFFI